jgi:GNAT superfamily N-acetyltransferase
MNVRTVRPEDIESLIGMGRRMHDEGAYKFLPFDAEKVRRLMEGIVARPDAWCGLVAEEGGVPVGMLGGYLTDYFFCHEKLACDLILFVERKWRGSSAAARLIRAFQDWADARGAREVCMSVSTDVDAEAVGRFYRGMGFTQVGGVYKFRLGNHAENP